MNIERQAFDVDSSDVEAKIKALRTGIAAELASINRSRDRIAEMVYELRTLTAGEGKFTEILEALGIPRQTAYDLIKDWEWRQNDLQPTEVVDDAARALGFDLTAKKNRPALEESKSEVQVTTKSEDAEKLVATIKAQSTRNSKSSKTDFMTKVIGTCDARWKEKHDQSEMLQMLERVANMVDLAPIRLDAYRSVEEVPRKLPETITMQKEAA